MNTKSLLTINPNPFSALLDQEESEDQSNSTESTKSNTTATGSKVGGKENESSSSLRGNKKSITDKKYFNQENKIEGKKVSFNATNNSKGYGTDSNNDWVVEQSEDGVDKNASKVERGRRGRGETARGRGRRGSSRDGGEYDRHSRIEHHDSARSEDKSWGSIQNQEKIETQAQSDWTFDSTKTPSTTSRNTINANDTSDWGSTVDQLNSKIEDWGFGTNSESNANTTAGAGNETEGKTTTAARGQIESKSLFPSPFRRNANAKPEVDSSKFKTYEEYLEEKNLTQNQLKEKGLNLLEPRVPIKDDGLKSELEVGGRKVVKKGEEVELDELLFKGSKSEHKPRKIKEGKIFLETPGLTYPQPAFRGGRERGGRSKGDFQSRPLPTSSVESGGNSNQVRSLLTKDNAYFGSSDREGGGVDKNAFPKLS